MSVIERAEQRMADECRQHELGLDNADDIRYWAAYLDGAREQKKESDRIRSQELNNAWSQGYSAACNSVGKNPHGEMRGMLIDKLTDSHVHGEWAELPDRSQRKYSHCCSVCHHFNIAEGEIELYNYCPNCGAKMEVQE